MIPSNYILVFGIQIKTRRGKWLKQTYILYPDDEIVNISKDKFILTILHILFLFEYQIPKCI